MNAFAIFKYVRVSRELQGADGKVSLFQQLADMDALCERNGWHTSGVFIDRDNHRATQAPKIVRTIHEMYAAGVSVMAIRRHLVGGTTMSTTMPQIIERELWERSQVRLSRRLSPGISQVDDDECSTT